MNSLPALPLTLREPPVTSPCLRSGPPPRAADATSQDSARLGPLARAHYAGLLRFVRRLRVSEDGAEDVAQSAFMTTFVALPRIAPGCERAFLYATAARIASASRRRTRRELLRDDLDLDVSPRPSPDELADRKRFREQVDALLDGLECPSRTVFVLFELDGQTIPEIALSMAISPQAATRRLRRTRRELRERVSGTYAPLA